MVHARRDPGAGRRLEAVKRLVLAPAILAVLAARADEPADRFHDTVTADRVVVDVRVIDNLGTPIAGLGVPDFSLRVDGRAVPIESVEWIPSGAPASRGGTRAGAGGGRAPDGASRAPRGSLFSDRL